MGKQGWGNNIDGLGNPTISPKHFIIKESTQKIKGNASNK